MDIEKEDTRLTELREALRRTPVVPDSVAAINMASQLPEQLSLDFSWCQSSQLSALTTDTIPCLTTAQITALDWSTISTMQHPILGTGQSGSPYIISSSINDSLNIGPRSSGKITLEGDDADIEINGESMVSVLRDIRDRLGIMKVSEEMEHEWEELRELRRKYEDKLEECRAKSQTWKKLTE